MSESPHHASESSHPAPLASQSDLGAQAPTWGDLFHWLSQRLFISFVLYVLSIGPLYWQWYRSQFVGGSRILSAFYLPLLKLAGWVPPFGAWLDWYINLWIA